MRCRAAALVLCWLQVRGWFQLRPAQRLVQRLLLHWVHKVLRLPDLRNSRWSSRAWTGHGIGWFAAAAASVLLQLSPAFRARTRLWCRCKYGRLTRHMEMSRGANTLTLDNTLKSIITPGDEQQRSDLCVSEPESNKQLPTYSIGNVLWVKISRACRCWLYLSESLSNTSCH